MQRLTLLVAMQAEAAPIIERLGLQPVSAPWPAWAPCRLWQGHIQAVVDGGRDGTRDEQRHEGRGGIAVDLVTAGQDERHGCDWIGTEPATLAATLAVQHLAPTLLASAGTAGGFAARGASIGTVYLSQGPFRFHGRHVPMPGLEHSVRGGYPSVDTTAWAQALALPQGPVSTGSSFARTPEEVQEIAAGGAVAKEMEAAAQAWVAAQAGIPFFAIKAITNLLDEPAASEEQFPQNLANATTALAESVERLVRWLAQTKGASAPVASRDKLSISQG